MAISACFPMVSPRDVTAQMVCSSETSEVATVTYAFGSAGASLPGEKPGKCESHNPGTNSEAKGCRTLSSLLPSSRLVTFVLPAIGGD